MDRSLKRNLIVGACLVAAAAAVMAVTYFHVPLQSVLVFGMVAACPLMHLFMGHGAHGGHGEHDHAHAHPAEQQLPGERD